MKKKSIRITLISGLVMACVVAALFYANLASTEIKHDLHLGFSPCIVSAQPAEMETVKVAVAALSDSVKHKLKDRYPWREASSPLWYESIPWFNDLVISKDFEPVLCRARGKWSASPKGIFQAHFDTSKWAYDLILEDDRNILWIVRNTHPTKSLNIR